MNWCLFSIRPFATIVRTQSGRCRSEVPKAMRKNCIETTRYQTDISGRREYILYLYQTYSRAPVQHTMTLQRGKYSGCWEHFSVYYTLTNHVIALTSHDCCSFVIGGGDYWWVKGIICPFRIKRLLLGNLLASRVTSNVRWTDRGGR